jgi:hypothetical protein
MDLDSVWQMNQANNNEYFDGHPPIMSYLWHWLIIAFPILKGSATIFLFCAFLFSSALALIALAEQKNLKRRLSVFLLVLLFPPVLLILGFVIKDTFMDVNLLLAYAMMLYAERNKSKLLLLFSLIPLFIGFCARYNSLFAVFPLCVGFGYLSCRHLSSISTMIKRGLYVGIGFFLLALLFVSQHFLEKNIIHADDSHSAQFLLAYDLVGVSVRSNENCLPSFYDRPDRPITIPLLKQLYAPYSNYYTFWQKNPSDPTLGVIWNKDQEKELMAYWFKALKNHPKEMFLHKVDIYLSALGVKYKSAQLKSNELSSPIGIPWAKIIPSQVLDGWVYLLLLTVIGIAPIPFNRFQASLFWSGYLYGLSWIISTPNSEQRYFSWMIITTTVLLAQFCVSRFRAPDFFSILFQKHIKLRQ